VSLLADILASKAREVDALREVPRRRGEGGPSADVARTLRRASPGGGPGVIAEIKLRSPSAGPLSRALSPAQRAVAYAEAGAAMVSVLCDGPFFDGSWDHVSAVRAALEGSGRRIPILAKEYVLDGRQIEEARDRGADAVLLIARIVPSATLARLTRVAHAEGLEPVLEVVDERELEAALEAGGKVIGVNARDLDTLRASGVARVAGGRADAILVGEALMREEDPRTLLRSMVRASENSAHEGARR